MGRHSTAQRRDSHAPKHRRTRAPKRKQKRGVRYGTAFAAAAAVSGAMLASVPSSADAATISLGNRILNTAETRTGDWYAWGGAGPYSFDCSGLVYWAARANGVGNMPRTTYGMLSTAVADGILRQTWNPQRGDLAFYGSGHVEFVTVWHDTTFGSQAPGTRVGWHEWNAWWHPTMFFTWTGRL